MLANYCLLALRNLRKHPVYSAINLAGLVLGTGCCLFILLYVRDHQGYDRQHAGSERIYRIVSDLSGIGSNPMNTACVSPPIAPTLREDFPDVEQWTRLVDPPEVNQHLLRNGNRSFFETRGYYVDSTFFKVFNYNFVAGSPEKCLDEPFTVVLTQPVAEKLFGDAESAIGQGLDIDNRYGKHTFRVTGVVDNSTGKSHIDGHFFMTMRSGELGDWVLSNRSFGAQNFLYGYIRLFPQTDVAAFAAKLPDFIQKHGGDQLREMGMQKVLHLEPVTAIHTESNRRNQLVPVVSKSFLHLLLLLAIFVQGIACINFMNLSTARASRRAKEVGIRKAIGAGRGSLIAQFLAESLLLCGFAIAVAVPVVWLSMPYLNQMTGANVQFSPLRDTGIWTMLAGLMLLTGLVAGSYPAFYLSGFQPVKVLKGVFSAGKNRGAAQLRRGLVTAQFVIAVVLIAGALIVRQQFNYLANIELGFEKEQKIAVPFRIREAQKALGSFKRETKNLAEIEATASVVTKFGEPNSRDFGIYKEGGQADNAELLRVGNCDEDYLPTMKIQLLYGRNFVATDTSNQLIVNEKCLQALNIPVESAVGKHVFSTFGGETNPYEIIGVARDFNFESLYQNIQPFGFLYSPTVDNQYAILSVNTGNLNALLPKIEAVWQKLLPGLPFEYSFIDEGLEKQYAADQTLARIISAFTLLTLFISCLGLFGLAAFAAEQRTKEIGIRKVLGASVAGITGLLAKDFLKLVVFAIVIAAPIAWWSMNKWLLDFAYRIEIQWWVFLLAGITAIVIAFLTVCFQSVKAGLANPVRSLRSE